MVAGTIRPSPFAALGIGSAKKLPCAPRAASEVEKPAHAHRRLHGLSTCNHLGLAFVARSSTVKVSRTLGVFRPLSFFLPGIGVALSLSLSRGFTHRPRHVNAQHASMLTINKTQAIAKGERGSLEATLINRESLGGAGLKRFADGAGAVHAGNIHAESLPSDSATDNHLRFR